MPDPVCCPWCGSDQISRLTYAASCCTCGHVFEVDPDTPAQQRERLQTAYCELCAIYGDDDGDPFAAELRVRRQYPDAFESTLAPLWGDVPQPAADAAKEPE
jgi:hypothetical protein